MKNLKRDLRGEWYWRDIIATLFIVVAICVFAITIFSWLKQETEPLEIRITNTSAEPLPIEIYVNGVYYLNDTIEPKQIETYEYKNGFWGPGKTTVTIKLPNTLFEKEGWGSQTVSFIFE